MYNRLNTKSTEPEAVELKSINGNSKSSSEKLSSSLVANDYTKSKPIISNDNQSSDNKSNDIFYHPHSTHSSTFDSSKSEPIIRLRNIHKTYLLGLEGVPALRGVSVTINRGEFIVILGKSGGGKTSMLNIIGTIDKPTKGDIYITGKRISNKTTDTQVANLRLRKIGFCFQTFNLIGSMTAVENVELPMILHGTLSSKQIRQRAMDLLTHVGLGNRAGHLPSQLSGGEQQRVTISRAVANNPDVLLLDEPTGDLDTNNSNIIMDLLVRLNREQNITCVFVTHDVSLKFFAHRVIHMLDGKISKIEVISQKRREHCENELQQALMYANSPNKKVNVNKKEVEIREPDAFYPYLAFKTKFDIKQKILKEKRKQKRIMRRKQKGNDYDENEDDISDNEIIGDVSFLKDDLKSDDDDDDDDDEIGLESAEIRNKNMDRIDSNIESNIESNIVEEINHD